MPDLTLEFFIEALGGAPPDTATPISDVVIDSREVGPGALFVALPGESSDGHQYVQAALERGAMAALVDQDLDGATPVIDLRDGERAQHAAPLQTPVLLRVDDALLALQEAARRWTRRWLEGDPDRRIIGITGSVGKTTTKELAADVLNVRYRTLRNAKSYNNEIGLPLTVLGLRDEHQRAVLEMGFYVLGEIDLLTSIAPPQVGVVTLIAPVHLERARSMENIVRGKRELIDALPPAPEGIAILNRDDALVMSMAAHTEARILTFGLTPEADIWADGIEGLGLEGIRFQLHHADQTFSVKLPLLGRHSAETALRAAAVGLAEGLAWDDILRGLQTTQNQLRLLAVKGPRDSIVLDDTYNASPPSTIAALNLLADLGSGGRHIAVLGDMLELGRAEERGHRDVGIRAAAVADLLVTVGPRGAIIADEARRQHMDPACIHPCETAEEAVAALLDTIQAGDAVLVKGSRAVGMERIVEALLAAGRD